MVQRTLCEYFRSKRPREVPRKVTFLHLPLKVRRDIYLLAGLPSNSTIYLNYICSSSEDCIQEYDPHYPEHWPIEDEIAPSSESLSHFLINGYLPWPGIRLDRYCACLDVHHSANSYDGCRCEPLPYQLLYVSKVIADEVSSIFYSENHFSVFRDSLGGLSGLNSLPQGALQKMTSLSICLNSFNGDSYGREFGPESWGQYCHAVCSASEKERLFHNSKCHDEVSSIKEWQQLCQLLKANIQPDRLKLSFICDSADLEIAEEVLRPFSQLPLLNECAIRLGLIYFQPNTDHSDALPLQQLAQQTVNKVTCRPIPRTFSYSDLPNEIQLQILGYTDLVTPYDIVWGFNTSITNAIKAPFYERRTFNHFLPQDSYCCGQCLSAPQACACWTRYAAYSSACTCWRFPLSFFVVSRKMREQAECVFYSKNHFFLSPRLDNKDERLEIWDFLKWIPGDGRRYLRSLSWNLKWNLEDHWGGYLRPDDQTHQKWHRTLQLLTHEIPPGQLRLTIDTCFSKQSIYYYHGGDDQWSPPVSAHHYIREAENTWGVIHMLAKDLAGSGVKLRDFFVQFVWPVEESEDVVEADRGKELEKLVMGRDYNGVARGKEARRKGWNGYRTDE